MGKCPTTTQGCTTKTNTLVDFEAKTFWRTVVVFFTKVSVSNNSYAQGLGMIYGGGKRLVRCCHYQSNKQKSWTYSWYKCSSLTNNIDWLQVSHEGKGKYSTELWSDEAVHTIQELANSTQPWFLQVHCLSWWWCCSFWGTEHYFHPSHSHPCLEFVVICL